MEGYLNKYINIVYRWKPRYFVLKNAILTYCDAKGEPPKGTIHLKISEIELTPEDPLKIIINSGTKTLLLRANTIGDKIKWLNALRSSKEEIQKKDSEYNKLKANFNVSTLKDFFQKYEDNSQNDSQTSSIKYNDLSQLITSKINEIWAEQIRFDETLKSLFKRLGPNSSVNDLLNSLETIGTALIKQMTNLTKLFESEKKNLNKMIRKIDHKLDKMEGIRMNVNDGKSFLASQEEFKEDGQSQQEFSSTAKGDSKFSFRSEELLNSPDSMNVNYEEYMRKHSKALSSIKEEDSPAKLHTYDDFKQSTAELKRAMSNISKGGEKQEDSKFQEKTTHELNKHEVQFNLREEKRNHEDNGKLKELQNALSISLNKIRIDEPLNSKVDNTVFESFEHYSPAKDKPDPEPEKFSNSVLPDLKTNPKNEDSSSMESLNPPEEEVGSPLPMLKNCDPVKKRLLTSNEAFKNLLLTEEPTRKALPKLVESSQEGKAWENLRNSLGKDISKFVVPIELHEPLSILQRFCEPYEQANLLEKTEEIESSTLRMAYVMGFAYSGYAPLLLRVKKPFDALLGETYEFVSNSKKKFRYYAEQVSYNPPIIATYCDSQAFRSWSNINLKSAFYGKYLEYRPVGVSHIFFNKSRDHYIWTKPVTNVENLLTGNVIVDNYGDMNFTNLATHETGVLSLSKCDPNNEETRYNATGYIKNSKGKVVYNIVGRLDKFLKVVEIETQKKTYVWEYKKEFELLSKNQYFFDEMTLQLNYLNTNILQKISSTDSRLRPDIRALEYLDYKVCHSEKKRLEEKEKKLKHELEESNEPWKPKWFVPETDEVTKLKTYVFVEDALKTDKENYIDIF